MNNFGEEEDQLPLSPEDQALAVDESRTEDAAFRAPAEEPVTQAPAEDPVTAPPRTPDDILRQRFGQTDEMMGQLRNAEDAANSGRLAARLSQAGANLGASIARSQPIDQTPFTGLAADAEVPVKQMERRIQLQGNQDKVLRDYFLRNAQLDQKKDYGNKNIDVKNKAIDTRSSDYGERTKVIDKGNTARIGLAGQSLALRQGNQAAQAAGKFNSDPVVKTSNSQLAQISKGLGRLDDVDSGKVPFSTTIKADIEKDIANVISGGSNSSLGQLHRVEFNPYIAKWQATLDSLKGYQGDINAPEFRQQLRAQLTGLRADIQKIQGKRSGDLQKSYGTAYSKNPLATQTVNENANLYGANADRKEKQQVNRTTGAKRTLYSDDGGKTWHP